MAQANPRRNTSRQYSPVKAAYAVAHYLPADPRLWLERCGLAGIAVTLVDIGDGRGPGLLIEYGDSEPGERCFLECWINLTVGGKRAVIDYLSGLQRPKPFKIPPPWPGCPHPKMVD